MQLESLINPRSIAIVGASPNPSIGQSVIQSLKAMGFTGTVYPINPKYENISDFKCYPSLDGLPGTPDVAAFCVNNQALLTEFSKLPALGVKAAVIYSSGFAEKNELGRRLQDEIVDIAREAGIALCGPNCMGVLNPQTGSSTFMQRVYNPSGLSGNVGFISQSGSISIGMLSDIRRFGFSAFVSSGNEAVLTTADYINYLVDDPNTRVIATFSESINSPEKYVAALDRAAVAGKPVVVVKVGKNERSRQAIASHTGGLAGESRLFSEVLRAHRAIEVDNLDDLTEVLAVCQGARWPVGERIAVATLSGGQAELILDIASTAGLQLPPLPEQETRRLRDVLGDITGDGNPLDAWGNGDYTTSIPGALRELTTSDAYDAVVFCSDHLDAQPLGAPDRAFVYGRMLADAARHSNKPHYFMNMRSGLMNREQAKFLMAEGIATVTGTSAGLGAIQRVARWSRLQTPVQLGQVSASAAINKANVSGRKTINEFDAKVMLADHGIRVTRECIVKTLAEGKTAAQEIGYPVVLKAISDDVPHKTEYGLVEIGLADEDELYSAWTRLQDALARIAGGIVLKGFVIQEMVKDGIEVFAGVSRSPDFGLSVAFGMGGVGIEILKDFQLRLLPLRDGDAAAMIAGIRGAPLLGSFRNRPAADKNSLIDCIERLATFAVMHQDWVSEIDLNPIKVLPDGQGCVVLDALIIPYQSTREK